MTVGIMALGVACLSDSVRLGKPEVQEKKPLSIHTVWVTRSVGVVGTVVMLISHSAVCTGTLGS